MKLAAVALDYDGTIAVDGVMHPEVRAGIAELRVHGIAAILVTGRRLADLKSVASDLECFNAVVAENGAVLYFPESQRHTVIGHVPPSGFLEAIRQLGIDFAVGDSVVECDGVHALSLLRLIRTLELPLMLAFNRSRLMIVPPGVAKSTGLAQAFRYPDVSIVIDLSKLFHPDKDEYLRELLPTLAAMRRQTGLPHKILLDEAHYCLAAPEGRQLVDAELAGYSLVTYRVSEIDEQVRNAADNVVMVTRETDPQEQQTLQKMCKAVGVPVEPALFQELGPGEAALLPGVAEAHGNVQRFRVGPRLTSHVRHRAKYLDMPVSEPHGFVFTHGGRPGPRARSLNEFVDLLAGLPDADLAAHLQRHEFSRWLNEVFRDHPLAGRVRAIESRLGIERLRDLLNDISQTVRARYEMTPLSVSRAG